MSVSQDSENGSPHHPNDHILHHSADSGFASTEVDQNHRLMLTLQRQMCVSEYEKSSEHNENTQVIKSNVVAVHIEECRKINSPNKGISCTSSINSETRSNITTLLPLTTMQEEGLSPHLGDQRKRNMSDKIEHVALLY